ncbi:unnamed protein product [Closterium sp. NIES-64]|nr:unnamed protein product [Closterium sp. NIES-64]
MEFVRESKGTGPAAAVAAAAAGAAAGDGAGGVDGACAFPALPVRVFRYVRSATYRAAQHLFEQTVASHDPNQLGLFVAHHPYHVEGLLALSEVYKQVGEVQTSADLLERALFLLEAAWHPWFNPSLGTCRLEFSHEPNRALFDALFRHMHHVGRRGCHRAAFELCRLLLSLDPDTDPLGALQCIDFYALRARQFTWLHDFVDQWGGDTSLAVLPNFCFALAQARLGEAEGDGEGGEGSGEATNGVAPAGRNRTVATAAAAAAAPDAASLLRDALFLHPFMHHLHDRSLSTLPPLLPSSPPPLLPSSPPPLLPSSPPPLLPSSPPPLLPSFHLPLLPPSLLSPLPSFPPPLLPSSPPPFFSSSHPPLLASPPPTRYVLNGMLEKADASANASAGIQIKTNASWTYVLNGLVEKAPIKTDASWTSILKHPLFARTTPGSATLEHLVRLYVEAPLCSSPPLLYGCTYVLKGLVEKAPIKTDSSWAQILKHPLFAKTTPGSASLEHLVRLYVERSAVLWRGEGVQTLLKRVAGDVVATVERERRAGGGDGEMESWKCVREVSFSSGANA